MDIVEQYYRKEYNNLIKRVKNRSGSLENAEDVVQESFAKALQYLKSYNPKIDFGAWFNSILENELKDYMRVERIGGMSLSIDDIEEESHDVVIDNYLPNLKKLNPLHRKFADMYFHKGYTIKEIAEITCAKFSTVDKFLERFRAKIRVGND